MFSLKNMRPLLRQRRAAVIQGIQEIFNKFLMQKFSTNFFIQIFHAKVSGKIFVGLDRDAGSSKLARFGIVRGCAARDRSRRRTEADNQQHMKRKFWGKLMKRQLWKGNFYQLISVLVHGNFFTILQHSQSQSFWNCRIKATHIHWQQQAYNRQGNGSLLLLCSGISLNHKIHRSQKAQQNGFC